MLQITTSFNKRPAIRSSSPAAATLSCARASRWWSFVDAGRGAHVESERGSRTKSGHGLRRWARLVWTASIRFASDEYFVTKSSSRESSKICFHVARLAGDLSETHRISEAKRSCCFVAEGLCSGR